MFDKQRETRRRKRAEKYAANKSGARLCAVCGQYELTETSYEICPICGWEDDPVQRRDPELRGGANKMSLSEARRAWKESKQ